MTPTKFALIGEADYHRITVINSRMSIAMTFQQTFRTAMSVESVLGAHHRLVSSKIQSSECGSLWKVMCFTTCSRLQRTWPVTDRVATSPAMSACWPARRKNHSMRLSVHRISYLSQYTDMRRRSVLHSTDPDCKFVYCWLRMLDSQVATVTIMSVPAPSCPRVVPAYCRVRSNVKPALQFLNPGRIRD